MRSKNQSGFAAVEAVLIVVIVAMIGFVGWYVLNAQKNTDKDLSVTNTTSVAPKKKAATKAATTSTSTTTDTTTYKIADLGIQLVSLPTDLTGLTSFTEPAQSSTDPNNTTTTPVKFVNAKFSSQSLTTADPACSAKDGTSIGLLSRVEGTYVNNNAPTQSTFVKQFSGFYISYAHPQAACSDSDAANNIQLSQTAAFKTYAENPSNIQLIQ